MNRYLLEKVLWEIVSVAPNAAELRDRPDDFLGCYRLGRDEAQALRDMDVKALVGLRINPMLVMRAFQMVHGRDQLPQYIRKLQDTPRPG